MEPARFITKKRVISLALFTLVSLGLFVTLNFGHNRALAAYDNCELWWSSPYPGYTFPGGPYSTSAVAIFYNYTVGMQSGAYSEGFIVPAYDPNITQLIIVDFQPPTGGEMVYGYPWNCEPGVPFGQFGKHYTIWYWVGPPLAPEPTADIKAGGSNGPISIDYNTSATIFWTSTDADSCTITKNGSAFSSGTSNSGTSSGNLTSTTTFAISCTGPGGGPVSDSVIINVRRPPTVPTVTITEPDYCISGPSIYVNWTYSDPDGDPQSAYQVQVDESGSSWSPPLTFDSGKTSGSGTSYFVSGGLDFNTTYKARVRVWDSYDNVSDWKESGSWKTPKHAYPYTDFTYSPLVDIAAKQPVQFTDQTIFYDSGGNRVWSWIFGDSTSSTQQSPTHTYNQSGLYNATLTSTDKDNYSCPRTKQINVAYPIPIWKEVNPK